MVTRSKRLIFRFFCNLRKAGEKDSDGQIWMELVVKLEFLENLRIKNNNN